MKRVSIITVNFNHHHVTEELLYSIHTTNTYPNLEIIVVDNGSKINPIPNWETCFPYVKFYRSEKNLGFAGGNNIGIEQANGDYFFLVNNDTEFTESLVEILVKLMDENPKIGIVSPKIRYFEQPELLQYAGFTSMNYFTARNKCVGQFEVDKAQYDNLTGPTGFVHGAAMMLRKEICEKAGFMAANYFLYYEEMDWCDRIKHAGFEVWVCMQATIYHKESISVGKTSALKEYFMNRNRILYIRSNAVISTRFIFYLFFSLVVVPRNILQYLKNGQIKFIPILFKAIWWNIAHKKDSVYLGYQVN